LDVVGELPVPGADGERYMLTVLDDFSRWGDSMALSSKSQVGGAVNTIILYLENQTGHKVKVVRSDRGSEFVNADMLEFFNSKGIRHDTSAPYTPQQNGRAERFNRSLKEKVRILLLQAEAPQSMWADALPTAVRLLNLRAVKGRSATPYELLFGRSRLFITYVCGGAWLTLKFQIRICLHFLQDLKLECLLDMSLRLRHTKYVWGIR
jgi:hypothetical protein